MEKRKVVVKYIYEGVQNDSENEVGVLLPGNRVFVTKDSMGIYDVIPTANPNVFICNLDENSKDHIKDYFAEQGNDFLINLIVA
jgi:hypothetical protein